MESDWIFCCECGEEDKGNGETVEDVKKQDIEQTVNDGTEMEDKVEEVEQVIEDSVKDAESSNSSKSEISEGAEEQTEYIREKVGNGEGETSDKVVSSDADKVKAAHARVDEMENERFAHDPDDGDDDAADIDYMIDKAVDCTTGTKAAATKPMIKRDEVEEDEPDGEDGGKSVLRRHSLSTGILIIWFVAVAVICIAVGGFGGATWQRGIDERNFDIERTAFNEKIATLESKAEEDQKELAELREFRGKLQELVMEYMVEDTTAARNILDSNTAANGNTNANSNTNTNTEKPDGGGGPGSFLDFLFGGGGASNNESATNNANASNANANSGSDNAAASE